MFNKLQIKHVIRLHMDQLNTLSFLVWFDTSLTFLSSVSSFSLSLSSSHGQRLPSVSIYPHQSWQRFPLLSSWLLYLTVACLSGNLLLWSLFYLAYGIINMHAYCDVIDPFILIESSKRYPSNVPQFLVQSKLQTFQPHNSKYVFFIRKTEPYFALHCHVIRRGLRNYSQKMTAMSCLPWGF